MATTQRTGPVDGGGLSDEAATAEQRPASSPSDLLTTLDRAFRDAVDDATVGLGLCTVDGRIIGANRAFATMAGRAKRTLAGAELVALAHPDDRATLADYVASVVDRRRSEATLEYRLGTDEGHQTWVQLRATPAGHSAQPDYLVVYLENVDERRRTDQALHYRVALDELLTAVSTRFITMATNDLDTGIEDALGAIGSFIGADRSYVFLISEDGTTVSNTHEWCSDGIEPQRDELQDIPSEAVSWALSTLSSYEVMDVPDVEAMPEEASEERELLQSQGIQSLVILPMFEAGAMIGFVGFDAVRAARRWPSEAAVILRTAGDIFANAVARKRMNTELRLSEERYRSVVEDLRSVLFQVDAAGRWRFLNGAWTELHGTDVESTLGTFAIDVMHPDDRAVLSQLGKGMVTGVRDGLRHEVRIMRADGGTRWVDIHARAQHDDDGRLVGVSGSMIDVTQRRAAEEEMRRARDEAERASRAKSEFLSRMSHELRTPLNAILGFGQLLELSELTGEDAENVGQIVRAGNHLLDLINEVLDIVRIEAGRIRMSVEPVHVGEVVRDSMDLVRPLAGDRGVLLAVDLHQANDVYARADRQRLKQVLVNLCANAVKYNRDAGWVRVSARTTRGGAVRLEVADSGRGIPNDRLDEVFAPFERLGAEETGVEGTGIGLSLAKRLVEAMQGSIGVDSSVGVGSTFWVELPSAANPLDATTVEEESSRTPSQRILYVEDNPTNALLVRRVVARRGGAEVVVAPTGQVALRLVREHRPDAILLDLHLPDMPGEDVLRLLRSDPRSAHIPVVVLTADTTTGQQARLLEAGAVTYLTKPVDVARLQATLDALLAAPPADNAEAV